jgi:hypothetical protein
MGTLTTPQTKNHLDNLSGEGEVITQAVVSPPIVNIICYNHVGFTSAEGYRP